MTQVGNLLRAAKALISDPSRWTQEGVYVTSDGCMCAQGALNRAYMAGEHSYETADEAANCLKAGVKKVRTYRLVTSYNDDPETTHADIMKLFDDAATMADTPEETGPPKHMLLFGEPTGELHPELEAVFGPKFTVVVITKDGEFNVIRPQLTTLESAKARAAQIRSDHFPDAKEVRVNSDAIGTVFTC